MKPFFVIIFLLFFITSNSYSKSTTTNLQRIQTACTSAFKKSMAEKTNLFCKCYSNNMIPLIAPIQVNPIIKWLEDKMDKEEQERHEPLLDMEYQVTSECDKNSQWIAPKILNSRD